MRALKNDLSWIWLLLLAVLLLAALTGCSHAPVTSGESLYEAQDEQGCWCGNQAACPQGTDLSMCTEG